MNRRLYFTLKDTAITEQVVDKLFLARIDEAHIHVMAKEGIPLGQLPRASLLQTSDIVHGLELGLVIGGITGLICGLTAMVALSAGTMIGAIILACVLIGAFVGSWTASMIGSDVPNSRLKRFEKALENGEILLMVDAPVERAGEITRLIEAHGNVGHGGEEPTIPAFP